MNDRRAALKLLLLAVPGMAGCAHTGHTANAAAPAAPAGDWTEAHMPAPDGRKYFHRAQAGKPPVVVLHEVLGLTKGCFALGDRLWTSGFSVFLPLLFGEPEGHTFIGGYLRSCGSSAFSCAAPHKSSAIMPSLQAFCEHVSAASGGRTIGVIGMCLTGAFPIWLMRSNVVAAPVVCQPTMPFSLVGAGDPTALGLSRTDLRLAIRRRDVAILGMRFTDDWRCPMQRFTVLSELFGERFETFEIPSGVDGAPDGHSVLVGGFWRPAYDRTVEFLIGRL